MTLQEAEEVTKYKRLVQRIDDPINSWGRATVLSDDGTTLYYRPRDLGGTRIAALVEDMELFRVGK